MSATKLLRRSSDAAATPSAVAAPSQQHYNLSLNWSSQQHVEEGRGGTSRRDENCAQYHLHRSSISSVAARS